MNYVDNYNAPMHFKGDIIITDPCYIMRDEENSLCRQFYPKYDYPSMNDYYPYGLEEAEYPDVIKMDFTLNDCEEDRSKATSLMLDGVISIEDWHSFLNKGVKSLNYTAYVSPKYQKAEADYNKALEKYNSVPRDDWDYCNCGEEMGKLGITQSAVAYTLYGDWGCTTFKIKNGDATATPKVENLDEKPLGRFCADAGLVGVFLVDEVMKYNPEAIEELREKDWCATFIEGFDGDITFAKVYDEDDAELRLVGDGNIKFVTKQTSL